MDCIINANKRVLSVLSMVKNQDAPNRFLRYCVENRVDDQVLLLNLLTREMVALSEQEYADSMNNAYLREHWFTVPEQAKDKEYADLVRWVLETRQKKAENITGYTIFTTTDCNARCFYCFEMGRSRIPMTIETAKKAARYIKDHCGGQKVRLSWFGGEPLFNREVIDVICGILRQEGIEYSSYAVSNGYLFDKETAETAVADWHIRRVQITLDGTEKTYNKVKAFIYKGGNPYQIVLGNIAHLLDAGIVVQIRLNMDLYNAEELVKLVEELSERFAGRKGLSVYASHIFQMDEAMADTHTEEEWAKRDEAMLRLEKTISQCKLGGKGGLSRDVKLNYCMADSGKAVTILPDGHIGLCEHFSEDEFIGHIDREGFDEKTVRSWKERSPERPECLKCFYYPDCIQLKKCSNSAKCFPVLRDDRLRRTKRAMLNEYERWKKQQPSEEIEEEQVC